MNEKQIREALVQSRNAELNASNLTSTLEAALAEVQKEPAPDYTMRLEVSEVGVLRVIIGGLCIGYIDESGKLCEFFAEEAEREAYQNWRDADMPIDRSAVEFLGAKYLIYGDSLQRINCDAGLIYDFTKCQPVSGCLDKNILRMPVCNTPIMF